MVPLHPRPSCHRHTRMDEVECPFCSARLEPSATRWEYSFGRAALMLGVVLFLATPNCGGTRHEAERPREMDPAERAGDGSATEASVRRLDPTGSEAGLPDAGTGDVDTSPTDAAVPDAATNGTDAGRSEQEADPCDPDKWDFCDGCEFYNPPFMPYPITFKAHSVIPEAGSADRLQEAAAALNENQTILVVRIRGHAHHLEGKAAPWLARMRAQFVYKKLVALGVEPDRLRVTGQVRKPLKPPAKEPGTMSRTHRRVELEIYSMSEGRYRRCPQGIPLPKRRR